MNLDKRFRLVKLGQIAKFLAVITLEYEYVLTCRQEIKFLLVDYLHRFLIKLIL